VRTGHAGTRIVGAYVGAHEQYDHERHHDHRSAHRLDRAGPTRGPRRPSCRDRMHRQRAAETPTTTPTAASPSSSRSHRRTAVSAVEVKLVPGYRGRWLDPTSFLLTSSNCLLDDAHATLNRLAASNCATWSNAASSYTSAASGSASRSASPDFRAEVTVARSQREPYASRLWMSPSPRDQVVTVDPAARTQFHQYRRDNRLRRQLASSQQFMRSDEEWS
jgi:hypothetical protein